MSDDKPKFFTVYGNHNLTVNDGVLLTERLAEAVKVLNDYYVKLNMKGVVTSGYRNQRDQLRIIIQYSVQYGLPVRFTDFDVYEKDQDTGLYVWQYNWSYLLNKGVKINPPLAAECLMDYFRTPEMNMKGKVIQESPHFYGLAIDIAGLDAAMPASYCMKEHADLIKNIVSERGNGKAGCTHLDIWPASTNEA